MPVFLRLLSAAFYATQNVFDARISNHILNRWQTILFYSGASGILILPCIVLLYGAPNAIDPHLWGYLALCGFLNCFYLAPYYIALKKTDTSVVAALFSLAEIMIPLLAIVVLGDRPSAQQFFGFFLVVFSGLVLSVKDVRRFKINSGFWIMLLSAMMEAINSVSYKKLMNETGDTGSVMFSTAVLSMIFSSALILIPSCAKDICGKFKDVKANLPVFAVVFFVAVGAFIAKSIAMAGLPFLTFRALSAVQPMFVLSYGIIAEKFFGKKMPEEITLRETVKKLTCFSLIVCGILLTMNAF